jgi:hypothetical protein
MRSDTVRCRKIWAHTQAVGEECRAYSTSEDGLLFAFKDPKLQKSLHKRDVTLAMNGVPVYPRSQGADGFLRAQGRKCERPLEWTGEYLLHL